MECLEDTMLRILLLAALVSTIIGIINEGLATGWTEGYIINIKYIEQRYFLLYF
mgnify:CR=1 FL=1